MFFWAMVLTMWNCSVQLKMISNNSADKYSMSLHYNACSDPPSLSLVFLAPLHDISLSYWQGSSGFPGFPGANGEKGARVRKHTHTHSLSTHTVPVCVWKSPRHYIPAQKKIDSYYKGICMVTWHKKITAAKSMLGREQKMWKQLGFHWDPLPISRLEKISCNFEKRW